MSESCWIFGLPNLHISTGEPPAAMEPCLDDTPSDDDFKLTHPEMPDPNVPDPLGADKERRKEVFAQMAHLCIRGMQEPSDIYVALLKETASRL